MHTSSPALKRYCGDRLGVFQQPALRNTITDLYDAVPAS